MSMKRGSTKMAILLATSVLSVFCLVSTELCRADSAEVLPRGVWRVGLENKFYFPTGKRFDPDGHTEDAAVDFNTNLNRRAFPALALVEKFFGMPPGSATLGRSIVDFEYRFNILEFGLEYGITDRLSVGLLVPYWWVENQVDARIDSATATVGKNPFLNAIVPLNMPGTVPLTTADVIRLLGPGLDINGDGRVDIPGYDYKRFGSFSGDGFSDVEAGFRYQYLLTDRWRLAVTAGMRFPTGEVDDPDNLTDFGRGDGVFAPLFRLNNDFIGVKNLILNATFRYDLLLPDTKTLRVLEDVNQPLSRIKERVDRDLGDVFEFEGSAKYEFFKGFTGAVLYKYGFKLKDDMQGENGHSLPSLEAETDSTEHVYMVGVSYSTLPLYQEKKFPLPLSFSLTFRDRFAGSNNVLKSKYLAFSVRAYF